MKTILIKTAAIALLIGTLATGSFAATNDHMSVNARLHHQHARIEQGARSKTLTHREARELRKRDARIRHAAMRDRRHNHGKLTSSERRRLEERLNNTSKAIYNKKHNQ